MRIIVLARKFLRNRFLDVAGCFAEPSNSIHILNGHMLTKGICKENNRMQFAKLLKELHKKCEFINFEDAVQMINDGIEVNHPVVAFSFDDGFTDCYEYIIPELEKYNIHVACFINPGFADAAEKKDEEYIHRFTNIYMHNKGKRPMSWSQIIDLHKRGHIIGAHTIDHYMTNHGKKKDLTHQIVDCKKIIEEHIGTDCLYFAWPYGRFEQINDEAIEIAVKAYNFVFSQTDHKHYFSYQGKVMNRRHFEPWWSPKHVMYFLKAKRI